MCIRDSRRVILIQDSGWFKKGGEALADYLKTPSPTTFFIFAEAEADKRNRLFKAVKESGCAVEFSTQDETTLKRWIPVSYTHLFRRPQPGPS